ncbi:MAG: SHOCT domain-containing protein [Culicoidibacterales bacterium]
MNRCGMLFDGQMIGGWFTMMLLIVIVIIGVIWFFSKTSERTKHYSSMALNILEERYAKGEIDEDEFRAKRSTLWEKRKQ